mmetsp:Transcript_12081/g.28635  ORF Transcript_12081/g.28635 Transcript_12081/m.28635 type:complete len:323 (+) Transcript_12081:117-1085(+)|eukprot:CAMPEP_0197188890 /NCGR_PEP_ID=MMETSP1423-20130617/18718_1 /TAXON_ID=476441 /ORGANISM="Pseudo-nitzschia heimii, Strain UNC1101" /LENGTH=322 /DNA_ID=CAMNT_0042640871 /DNA_START=94 /DNA_END=1062 /DNA_ORIENTATION=-
MENSWTCKPFACAVLNDDSTTGDDSDKDLEQDELSDSCSSYDNGSDVDENVIQSFDSEDHDKRNEVYILSTKNLAHKPNTVDSITEYDGGKKADSHKGCNVLIHKNPMQNYNDDSSFSWRSILESDMNSSFSITADENENSCDCSASLNSLKKEESVVDEATNIAEKEDMTNHGTDQIEKLNIEASTTAEDKYDTASSTAEDKYDIETILNNEFGDSHNTDDNLTEVEESPKLKKPRRRQLKKWACIEISSSTWYYGAFIICMSILIIYFSIRLYQTKSYGGLTKTEKLRYIASEQHQAEPLNRRVLRGQLGSIMKKNYGLR